MERDSPANVNVGKEAKEGDQTKKRMSPAEKMVKNLKKTKKTIEFHFRQDIEQRRPKSKWIKCGRKINYACKRKENA